MAKEKTKKNKTGHWSKDDQEFLGTWFATLPIKTIAEALNRSVESVARKATELGLVPLQSEAP